MSPNKSLPRLAIALDAPSLEPLEPILDALHGLPVLAKVGLSLFTAVGPSVVHHMRLAGFEVFLDLKLHDIPHQVGLAVAAAARLDVAMLTVHTAGLVSRIVLQGRPPVTNLYSSAVFVGWGAVVLGAILERLYRNGFGTAVATADTALVICSAVAVTPCPKEMVARSMPYHLACWRKSPDASPGRSMSLFSPKPKEASPA